LNPPVSHPDIRGVLKDEILEFCVRQGEPRFRADQLLDWLYRKRVMRWEAMTNLAKSFREKLAAEYAIGELRVAETQGSADTTRKFLLRLPDDELIETVLVPASAGLYGDHADRQTLCVSTQVGCAYGCEFCASGKHGFRRNLAPAEIVGQLLAVEAAAGEKVNNLVFMGMGEPLANYDSVLRAIRIFNAPWGLGIGARKMTISTAGLAPAIRKLADEKIQVHLAISLHAARDALRNRLMPINRKHPLAELMSACEAYRKASGRLITIEYILIEGVNDGAEENRALAALANRLRAKVNLIPYNPVHGTPFKRPSDERCERFRDELARQRVGVTLRLEKGGDIDAACGQLRLRRMKSDS
jgi:23S rRNA (adenine2503-C2)-methyltransferase